MRRTAGFTLLEVLIAAGIMAAVAAGLVLLLYHTLAAAASFALHRHAYAMAEDLDERWDAEAASALAVFVPPSDVLGAANGDGHEVDFFTRDGHGTPFFWTYRYDAAAHTLQRYTYAAPGATAARSGDPLPNVSSFTAAPMAVNAFSEPIFQAHANVPVTENLGYPGVDGGNRVTELHLVTGDDDVTSDLLPGVSPSGFTVVVGTFTPPPSPLIAGPPLTFASPTAPAQTFTISQQWYRGSFTVSPQCIVGTGQGVAAGTVAATVTATTPGPNGSLIVTVTPNASMKNTSAVTCSFAIKGDGGQAGTEWVKVDPPLPSTTPSPANLSLTAVANTNTGGSCVTMIATHQTRPILASQIPSEGSASSDAGFSFSPIIVLGPPFQSAFSPGNLTPPGVVTDTNSWNTLVDQARSLPGSTQVYITVTATLYPACGGGA
ncbi:hypothetical protein EPN44_00575 [bacterium]|nr:MAG: hypothetical protein EPN44_00575 [bacterium]